MSFSYWGFTSYLEVRSERYEFSNADHQAVTFENPFRSFYGNYKKITKCSEFNKFDYVQKLTWV